MDFLRLNIKHLRVLNGLTQPQLGEILGVSRDNIASYERGTAPPVDIIHKFVNHFHVRFNDLLEQDLSKFQSKNIEGVIVDMERNLSKYPEKEDTPAPEVNDGYRTTTVVALERVIEAQKVALQSQRETIDALKALIEMRKPKIERDEPISEP